MNLHGVSSSNKIVQLFSGKEFQVRLRLDDITFPMSTCPTKLSDQPLLPVCALENMAYEELYTKYLYFNHIQTHGMYSFRSF